MMTAAAEQTGIVSRIQDFSVNDGEGLRTIVFLAGCPLRCKWCANPEMWTRTGEELTVASVVAKVMRGAPFFRASGGGVTFSGGEACSQPEFLAALIEAFDDLGIDMTLETCGVFAWEPLAAHLGRLSLVFVDIKHMDDISHRRLTGRGNTEILANIRRMGELGLRTIIRIPLVPGANDDRLNLERTAAFVRQAVPDGCIEILPYHNYGDHKYRDLGLTPPTFAIPTAEAIRAARNCIEQAGVATVDFL